VISLAALGCIFFFFWILKWRQLKKINRPDGDYIPGVTAPMAIAGEVQGDRPHLFRIMERKSWAMGRFFTAEFIEGEKQWFIDIGFKLWRGG
jgi:hypothetical protein